METMFGWCKYDFLFCSLLHLFIEFYCLFQAKDTPEPDFDLSDCNLKDIPSGVFVLCRVLLKQHLNLQNNQLQSLNGGGSLKDLSNLTVINLSFNRFTRVPDEFCNTLKNLRVNLFYIQCSAKCVEMQMIIFLFSSPFRFAYRNYFYRTMLSTFYPHP